MAVVKHVRAGSAFKVGLVLYGIIGLIVGIFCLIVALAGASFVREGSLPFMGPALGAFAVILCPILYGLIGGIFAAIGAFLYNLAAGWVGGLEVDLT